MQQYVTNDKALQEEIDESVAGSTPDNVKLFGLKWDRINDTLSTQKLMLDISANTKRLVLKTIAMNFDPYNFNGPVLNRARLFMHRLEIDKSLGWDTELSADQIREWHNIAKQVNLTPEISVPRFIASREGTYRLIAFIDSSKCIYGTVIFMQNVESKQVSFILGKNSIVNTQLEGKSVPSLECQVVALGTETLVSLKEELSGTQCVKPIEIVELVLYTDSLVSLNWISNAVNKLDKINKVSVFIKNRLNRIQRLCDRFPVKFNFVSGEMNPADCITRALSYKQLMKTNYFLGPKFLISGDSISHPDGLEVIVPNLNVNLPSPLPLSVDVACADVDPGLRNVESLVDVDKYSNFQMIVRIHMKVLTFVHNLKSCLKNKDPDRYAHLDCYARDLFLEANKQVIESNQRRYFPGVYHYFESKQKLQKDIPNIVQQLNVFMDNHGILRVRSKVSKLKNNFVNFPMLLHKKSRLTQLIIMDMHCKFCHAGV